MNTAPNNAWNVTNLPLPAHGTTSVSSERSLPPIVSAYDFLLETHEIPPELVEGMIHQGTLTMFAGGSKAAKTFTLMDLATSVSQGVPWWGRNVARGRVLYINFELGLPFVQTRLFSITEAKLLNDGDQACRLPDLDLWNLRGHAAEVERIIPQIIERCRDEQYSLIILDPMYKLLGGRNENAAGEMAEVVNCFDDLAHQTGAAVVYSHHFAKGSSANKEQLDRASGSGVFSRHADAIITITPHETEGAVVVEATLRNLPAPAPFVMRWSYPLMRPAPDLDPTKLKSRVGRKRTHSVEEVLSYLQDGMSTGEWQTAACKDKRMGGSTFAVYKKQAIDEQRIEEKQGRWYRTLRIAFDPAATFKDAA